MSSYFLWHKVNSIITGQITRPTPSYTVIAVCFLWVSVTMLVLECLLNGNKTNFNIRNNLAENKRPQYEALGNNYRVCGVYSLEPYYKVYCVRLNFNISQSVWYYNSCQGYCTYSSSILLVVFSFHFLQSLVCFIKQFLDVLCVLFLHLKLFLLKLSYLVIQLHSEKVYLLNPFRNTKLVQSTNRSHKDKFGTKHSKEFSECDGIMTLQGLALHQQWRPNLSENVTVS